MCYVQENVLKSDAVGAQRLLLLPILAHPSWGEVEPREDCLPPRGGGALGEYLLCIVINKDYNHHNQNNQCLLSTYRMLSPVLGVYIQHHTITLNLYYHPERPAL